MKKHVQQFVPAYEGERGKGTGKIAQLKQAIASSEEIGLGESSKMNENDNASYQDPPQTKNKKKEAQKKEV
jgi:hypothetical protein